MILLLLLVITIIMKTSFNSMDGGLLRVWEVVCLYVEARQGVTSGENRFITA